MTNYFLLAGEASGDRHGSHLMAALRKHSAGDIHITGVGGAHMRAAGLESFPIQTEELQVMGFASVMMALPRLWKLFYRVCDLIIQSKPDCVILIDYPGFNLRLAKALRAKKFSGKIVQYICPSVWAHGKGRIKSIVQNYDLLLTIYPFENQYFAHTNLLVKYIGNPVAATILQHHYQNTWKEALGINTNEPLIALFPGSRLRELQRHLPAQLAAVQALQESFPNLQFAVSCAHAKFAHILTAIIEKSGLQNIKIVPPQYTYELMQSSHTALVKSGTVTLELALHSVPAVVHYDLCLLDYCIAKYILRLRLPHYCIVNILRGKEIYPELIDHRISLRAFIAQIIQVYQAGERREGIIKECCALKEHLGALQTHNNAAQAIVELNCV